MAPVDATVQGVMARRVGSVREDASFEETADMLRRTRISAAAVVGKPEDFEVTVRDGIVTISGLPQSEQATRALLDGARHVQVLSPCGPIQLTQRRV